MSEILRHGDPCPGCGEKLEGLATRCWAGGNGCGWTLAGWEGAPGGEPRNTLRPADEASARVPDTRSEKSIQAAIVATLRAVSFHVYDLSQPFAAAITPGMPDLWVCGHGHRVWVEVKTPRGKLSEAQETFRRLVLANGGEHYVWRSENEAMDWAEEVLGRRPAA